MRDILTVNEKAAQLPCQAMSGRKLNTEQRYSTSPQPQCQPELADILLDKIDPRFADITEDWWRIGAAYRNSGGSQERFIEWSHTEKYNVQKQVERGWNNCKLTAGIGTLAYYARLSGNPDIVNELQHQHPWISALLFSKFGGMEFVVLTALQSRQRRVSHRGRVV